MGLLALLLAFLGPKEFEGVATGKGPPCLDISVPCAGAQRCRRHHQQDAVFQNGRSPFGQGDQGSPILNKLHIRSPMPLAESYGVKKPGSFDEGGHPRTMEKRDRLNLLLLRKP